MATLHTRRNAFGGGTWAEPILWYARAVKAMKSRPFADRTSWTFYAGIHGTFRGLWNFYGHTSATEPDPSPADAAAYLDQCQHQSWFFLPWHRGYLLAIEKILRREIELLGGPHATWALPYWNYYEAGHNVLPPEFLTRQWPDGGNDNPLFVEQRWGEIVVRAPFDLSTDIDGSSMEEPAYFGPGGVGRTAGFGGPVTGFNLASGTPGALELNPHGAIHVLVGGSHPTLFFPPPNNNVPLPGLMSDPSTAAIDPIFYLHHCNIDRLWEAWNNTITPTAPPIANAWKNPTHSLWLEGPANTGQRTFAMPNPDGSRWDYTPDEMQEISDLGYDYDTLAIGTSVETDPIAARISTLGMRTSMGAGGPLAMKPQDNVEMIAANDESVTLAGREPTRRAVTTIPELRDKVADSLAGMVAGQTVPDRVFLSLEKVTGLSDAVLVRVYVGRPEIGDGGDDKDYLAGSIALFGVTKASDEAGPHAGEGITFTLEITKIVDKLHLEGKFKVEDLQVDFVPVGNIPAAAQIKVGKIRIYRQFE